MRKYTFEIFGFDFMLDCNFEPFLIEVNSNPGYEESSPLIKMLVPRMLDDALRLTVDKEFGTIYHFGGNEKHSFDLVVCNPPYKAVGSGIQNENNFKKLARHEIECSIDDIIKKASEFLRYAGRFCICQRPDRLCDVICLMRKYNIEPKKLRFVQARENVLPKLFLLEGKYGRNPGLIVIPTLMLENQNGERSDELNKIYNFYGENKNDR